MWLVWFLLPKAELCLNRWAVDAAVFLFTENSVFGFAFINVLYEPLATVSGAAKIHVIFNVFSVSGSVKCQYVAE